MDAVTNAINAIGTAFTNVFPGVTMGQMAVVAVLLLILVVIFLCTTIAKGRLNGEFESENERLNEKLKSREDELRKTSSDSEKLRARLTGENEQIRNEKDDIIADLNAQLEVLRQFHDKYQSIPDAEKEAARILNDAKNKAFIVANRTEKEYIELIDHANKEAESIRQLAQERLTRSHETLKNAIARANEIVDEARADVSRVSGVTYVREPARIEAPASEVEETEE